MDPDFRLVVSLAVGAGLALFLYAMIGGLVVFLPLLAAYIGCKGWTWTVIDNGKRQKRKGETDEVASA